MRKLQNAFDSSNFNFFSSQGTSISTPGAQIGFILSEIALPCLVCTPKSFKRINLGQEPTFLKNLVIY
jgi:hypothetical protein